MNKVMAFVKRNTAFITLMLILSADAYAGTGGTGTAKEMDDVWTKISDGVSGTYGKLATIGIVGASIWNREKIGMLPMGVGIIIGMLVPSIPGIIDKVGYTI